jgi:flavin reductase
MGPREDVILSTIATELLDVRLKHVLRFTPAPVSIVTSYDPHDGTPVGLAVSAFMPVSLAPCAMAICVNRSGSAHQAMVRARRFCINLLNSDQGDHVTPFADPTARARRFTQPDWQQREGLWFIEGAPASMFCTVIESVAFGTHDLLVGEVTGLLSTGEEDIIGWVNRALSRPSPLP